MRELTKTCLERLHDAIREREKHIAIPEQGVKIDFFTKTFKQNEVEINLTVNDLYKGGYKLNETKPKPRVLKVRYIRKDLAKLDGVIEGAIPRVVPRNFIANVDDTIEYINHYLKINLSREDINLTTFSNTSDLIRIKTLPTSLRYVGELLVYVIRED